ncbi:hypothetical protein SAMD00019534_120670 [Acytostelium subglobosum LB1]|uniref:hypothetical protein n=1 Tax=Acytostelium subglobosum LB1 TaxID=1410327 RepID=UPI000644F21B|nr:hypothetical protein SAMD00019534_120670 [Acytostelium subglobosum LB1]GAM28891.1 hypothetical protein SAMD00019534_120670 [Acytostelium subglobosum LB1]|eukprot:XP_012748076.1 hypothetical protein SAMD00019534_120670 [Acytostelium subglobosum LB1]
MLLVDDFQLFKVIMKHVHQFHCSRDTIRWEKNPSLIKSIGSVCDAQEFITWIGVLADCIQDYQIRQILSSTLHQYFSLEMLENMHRTFPQVIRDVDWLSTTICSSIENYLIYLEFKAGKSDIFDSSTCFIEAAAHNGDLELLQLIHSHCIDTGLPFAIGSTSIGIAVKHGGCIEVVSFLLDHLDNEVEEYIVGSIHPSIQSDTLLQQLVTRPNITFSSSTLESLLLSSNFELFKAVERLMHQRQQVMSKFDYRQLLNQLSTLPPGPEIGKVATLIVQSILHNHPDFFATQEYNFRYLLHCDVRSAIIGLIPRHELPFTLSILWTCISDLNRIKEANIRLDLFQQLLDSDIIAPRYLTPFDHRPMDEIFRLHFYELLVPLSRKYPNICLAQFDDGLIHDATIDVSSIVDGL